MAPKPKATGVEQKIADAINKAIKKEVAAVLAKGGFASEVSEVIPTGLEVFDRYLIGCGGLPVGRASEVFGVEGSGKSAFSLQSLGNTQKVGGLAILAETEQASSMERAKLYGVDPEKLLLLQPESVEDTLEQIEAVLDALPATGGPTLIAWDSVAQTPCRAEIEEGVTGKVAMGLKASVLSHGIRVLTKKVSNKRAHLMFINQVREKIGGYGYSFETPGGHAIKFYSSFRLQLIAAQAVKTADTVVGREIKMTMVKNKVGLPNRKATFQLGFEDGWRGDWALLNHAKDMGCIEESARGAKAAQQARVNLGWVKEDNKEETPLPEVPIEPTSNAT
jgi:recombination protein RecA